MRHDSLRVEAEFRKHLRFRDLIRDEFPNLDDETLADTLEGETDLRPMLAELVRSALDDEALSSGLSTRLAEMKARVQRLELRGEKKRELARRVMAEAEIRKLVEPDFTASLRQGAPPLEVLAEERIPPTYWKPQPPKLDRLGLMAALKRGDAIEGAALGAAQVQLNVRTK